MRSWDEPTVPIPEERMRQLMGLPEFPGGDFDNWIANEPDDSLPPEDESDEDAEPDYDPEITLRMCRACFEEISRCKCPPRTL